MRDRYWCWTATDETGAVAPVANCFCGSPPALAALGVERGPSLWVRALGELRPELPLEPAGALLTTWADDPYAQMAYSAHRAGHRPDDEALQRSVGRLFFAGEHTAGAWAGLMEGALRSGHRAAGEVMALGG